MGQHFKGKVVVVPTGAPARVENVDTRDVLTYLQGKVGGYIEIVRLRRGDDDSLVAVVDDCGALKDRPLNLVIDDCPCGKCSAIRLRGGVVLLVENHRSGDFEGIPDDLAEEAREYAEERRAPGAGVGQG